MCLLLGIANSYHDPVPDSTLAGQARENSNIDRFRAIACNPPHLLVLHCMSKSNPTEVLFYFTVWSTVRVQKEIVRKGQVIYRYQRPTRHEMVFRARAPG